MKNKVVVVVVVVVVKESCHKYVNYYHPGECSPEKDCLW